MNKHIYKVNWPNVPVELVLLGKRSSGKVKKPPCATSELSLVRLVSELNWPR